MNMSKQQPVWIDLPTSGRTMPVRAPRAILALVSLMAAAPRSVGGAIVARTRHARARREIVGMGPYARMELHASLIAQGGAGIDERLWSAAERSREEALFWGKKNDHTRDGWGVTP